MHLVVDDQTPLLLVEQGQVRMTLENVGVAIDVAGRPGQHVVGSDGDRTDVFVMAGVLTDLTLGKVGFFQ